MSGNTAYVVSEYIRFRRVGRSGSAAIEGAEVFAKNLTEFIQEQPGLVPEAYVLDFLRQLLDVLEYAHAYRDEETAGMPCGGMHPSHILLEDLGNGVYRLRLTDLGAPVSRERRAKGDAYLSPEELQGQAPAGTRSSGRRWRMTRTSAIRITRRCGWRC